MVSYIKGGIQAKVFLKTGSCGEYLGLTGMRMGSGEGSTRIFIIIFTLISFEFINFEGGMRNFIVCTVHLI